MRFDVLSKYYEKFVSKAKINGKYDKLFKSIILNKTAPSEIIAKSILDEYIEV